MCDNLPAEMLFSKLASSFVVFLSLLNPSNKIMVIRFFFMFLAFCFHLLNVSQRTVSEILLSLNHEISLGSVP